MDFARRLHASAYRGLALAESVAARRESLGARVWRYFLYTSLHAFAFIACLRLGGYRLICGGFYHNWRDWACLL